MAEYIERMDTFSDEMCEGISCGVCPFYNKSGENDCQVVAFLRSIPAADVRPVVRGKWVNDHNGKYSPAGDNYFCSACKDPSLRAFGKPARTNFCPNCGAQMIGGDDDV